MLGLLQLAADLLAAAQLTDKQPRQPQAGRHQRQGKTAQNPGAAVPAGQDGIHRLGHIHHQGVVAHMPEGIKALNAVEHGATGEDTAAGGLAGAHVVRARQAAAHRVLTEREPRKQDTIGAEQVQGATGPQFQRLKKALQMCQPDGAHHHPGQFSVGVMVGMAHGQTPQPGQARAHRRSHIQALVGSVLEHPEIVAIGKVGLAGFHKPGIEHDVTGPVQHQNGANALRTQRIVEQRHMAHIRGQGHQARVGHPLRHPLHRLVKRLHRVRDALLQRAGQVGVGALGIAPGFFAQRPDAAGKQAANAQRQQHGQQDQTESDR